ncbi:MAG TPA: hypothetical protein VEZ55_03420, partial [Chitinophagaceae bacterium]|nr:hypothetical protein [Chitinophagaceae bacterium]
QFQTSKKTSAPYSALAKSSFPFSKSAEYNASKNTYTNSTKASKRHAFSTLYSNHIFSTFKKKAPFAVLLIFQQYIVG